MPNQALQQTPPQWVLWCGSCPPCGVAAELVVRRRRASAVDVAAFIAGYTSADEGRVRFDWNGQHAEGFVDRNMAFREPVRVAVLADVSAAPLELVRDLFRAETECSREAWGIVEDVSVLAEELLRRGGPSYLDDYLAGKFQSFDANLGSAFAYDLPLARTMLAEVRSRLAASPDSPKAGLWQAGEELFARWVADCEQRHAEPGAAADPAAVGLWGWLMLAVRRGC
jgi:hypothetical protein